MAFALDSDPIITAADLSTALNITGDNATILINSASAKFRQFTNRKRITSGSVTEYQRGIGPMVFWVHATPVTAVTSIHKMSDGVVGDEITAYDHEAATGRFALHSGSITFSDAEFTLKVIYTGGWTTVPGDIMEAALELIRFEHAKKEKARPGIISESIEGHSVSYERGSLPDSVWKTWLPYRMLWP